MNNINNDNIHTWPFQEQRIPFGGLIATKMGEKPINQVRSGKSILGHRFPASVTVLDG
jgi:hypothetical protein